MASVYRIKGAGGVVIDSTTFLELPKAAQQTTSDTKREGMIRYNTAWSAFEGVIKFTDGSVAYRRFAQLDNNGRLLTSQLPDSVTSGLEYVGTYSPLSDDIDPPMTAGVYTALPMSSSTNLGDYYIIRGIMDAAQAHYTANNPTTATVTFTPTNPSGQGNWLQIKYYVDANPSVPGTKMVSAAFGRLVTPIPAGHDGLTSLATDPELTAAFSTSSTIGTEKALTDGDWVIMTTNKVQRLRNTRVSILASSVSYDNSIINGSGRRTSSSGGTVQTVIDTILLDGLRRTGDSMVNDGSTGKGRFAVVNGTATEPSIAFNDAAYNPTTNPGTDPTKWTDTRTGIFRQAAGSIGLTSNGTERLRVDTVGLKLFQGSGVNQVSNPAIQISGTGNTVPAGITALNNIIYLTTNGKSQVEIADGTSTFNYNVTIKGNTIIGDASTDTLVVTAASTFNNTSNRFNRLSVMPNGIITLENATTPSTVAQVAGDLKLTMGSFSDVTIYDGATIRTRFNRYGVQLPVLNPIDNSVGVDGMIAFSPQRNTVMQKANGQWTTVSGGGVEQSFTTASWVLSGANYTYTITGANIQSVRVQEAVGSNFNQVEVDSVVISSTNAVISIPSSPDVRFAGRVIITYR